MWVAVYLNVRFDESKELKMILIPEIKTIVILTPRTGSGSARRAIEKAYPKSMMIYRHMEADGVPQGYDRWEKVGVLRNPTERLWSLYKFLRNFDGDHDPAYIDSMRSSVTCGFNEWLTKNQIPFTTPYDSAGDGRFFPNYTVRHPVPENQKSQFIYLRPDLGTTVYPFSRLDKFADRLGIKLNNYNATEHEPVPELSDVSERHVNRYFKWDLENFEI